MSNDMVDLRDRPAEPSDDRLDSWKEIAGYLKHSERTVRRWQDEGLPVHRHAHKKRAGVYAYKPEIDAWWKDGRARLEEPDGTQTAQGRRWLPWLAAASVLVLLLVSGVYLVRGRRHAAAAAAGRIESVAVLPLRNLSNDPDQEYFADGMTDELITALAKVGNLRVISHTSVMRYKATSESLTEIARELNVDAVVEGTVLPSGNRVRITAQLIRVPQETHLWADSYQRDLTDVLSLQGEVARAIADEVAVKLTPQQQMGFATVRQVDPLAHDAYLRGLYLSRKGEPASTEKAIGYFEQAITRNPNDPLVYAALSDAYASLTPHARAPLDVLPKAKAAAARAVQLDDTLAEAHASLAYIKLWFDWDWPGAEHEYRRALELNSNLPKALTGYAAYLATIGRVQEAINEVDSAHQLDPVSLASLDSEASVLIYSRRYAEAVELCLRKIELEPNADRAYAWLAVTQTLLGHHAEAVNAADHAVQAKRGRAPYEAVYAYAMAGQKDKARKMFASLVDPSGKPYVCGYNMGIISLALGEKDRAVNWLEKAHRDHST